MRINRKIQTAAIVRSRWSWNSKTYVSHADTHDLSFQKWTINHITSHSSSKQKVVWLTFRIFQKSRLFDELFWVKFNAEIGKLKILHSSKGLQAWIDSKQQNIYMSEEFLNSLLEIFHRVQNDTREMLQNHPYGFGFA